MNTVSFVFQNSRLIKASILENVRMGRPGATREEVLAALHNAQCDDILAKLPDGADIVAAQLNKKNDKNRELYGATVRLKCQMTGGSATEGKE